LANLDFTLTDMSGRVRLRGSTGNQPLSQIGTDQLESGLYLVRLKGSALTREFKIIKQ
jgi:hypothetical protein